MRYLLITLLLSTSSTFAASGESCQTGQYSCAIDKPFSSTCCTNGEKCTKDSDGLAACGIPKKEEPKRATATQTKPQTPEKKKK